MEERKATELAFDEERKEKFIQRLRLLIGARSVRSAATDWGMSFSTLNNYLTRGTEPSFAAMQLIASKEQVTLDWLAFGNDRSDSNMNQSVILDEAHRSSANLAQSTWSMIFETLTPEEQKEILDFCLKEGARSMVGLVASAAATDRNFMSLSAADKERLLRLNEQLKKGPSEGDSGVAEADLQSDTKKVG